MRHLTLVAVVFLLLSCSKNNSKEVQYPISDFLENCSPQKKDKPISMIDSLNYISMSFPLGWDIEKVNEKSFNGIYSMDTSAFLNDNFIHTIQVNSVNTNNSLQSHFEAELRGLKNDSIPITEIGEVSINNQPARWIMTSRSTEEGNFKDVLIYTGGTNPNQIIIIHLSVNDGKDFRKRLCQLKSIANSIEFLKQMQVS